MTFLSHNSDFCYWNCEFTSCNLDFIRIVRNCKFTIARKKSELWDKVTINHYPLYSMAEISFHRFHMWEKQTNIKMHSPAHILTPLPYLFSLFLIQLFLFLCQACFFSLICVVLHPQNISKRSFLLYVVDVIERASTPDYFSNWDWNQLFLNISVILKMLISCYNILYRTIVSIPLSCFILYLRFGTLGLHFWHAVFKHL